MGNFICAVVILSLVVIFTGVNSVIICDICDDMIGLIDSGYTEEAKAIWIEKRDYISVFVRDAEVDVVNSEAESLGVEIPVEDAEAAAATLKFREAVVELRNSESPFLLNIL